MEVKLHRSIVDFMSTEWNALLAESYPFMRYEFLAALEQNNGTGPRYGWLPRHIGAYADGKLIGALANYEKDNTYGEFVFDWSWADAYQRHGLPYYPKWVVAAPYTPATGPRLLIHPDQEWQAVATVLIEGLQHFQQEANISSLHILFTNRHETEFLMQQGFMTRLGCQFHWHNQDYRDFQDFLDSFTSKKRKNIKQERRYAQASQADIEIITGNNATEDQLAAAELFYRRTFDEKYGTATLNLGFFTQIARTMGDQLVLIMASRNQQYIAGAICFRDKNTLYGRHWGCIEEHDHLHFEVCFYQGIEYCISEGLQRFEPGAQGEHKISRGFLPTPTWSSHWINHPEFRHAIQHFLNQETAGMEDYIATMTSRSPYKKIIHE
jgi:predicted N-acyltransferase